VLALRAALRRLLPNAGCARVGGERIAESGNRQPATGIRRLVTGIGRPDPGDRIPVPVPAFLMPNLIVGDISIQLIEALRPLAQRIKRHDRSLADQLVDRVIAMLWKLTH
jgi:hypothetical protein